MLTSLAMLLMHGACREVSVSYCHPLEIFLQPDLRSFVSGGSMHPRRAHTLVTGLLSRVVLTHTNRWLGRYCCFCGLRRFAPSRLKRVDLVELLVSLTARVALGLIMNMSRGTNIQTAQLHAIPLESLCDVLKLPERSDGASVSEVYGVKRKAVF